MENVVATVSGYQGSERFKLIKLISNSGASYVGSMSRSVTHLVCWRFEGKKYNLAKKFDTIVVNHQWVEECIKQGKKVPEAPYMSRSGEEVGPLMIEVPLTKSMEGEVTKKGNKLAETSDRFCNNGKERCGISDLASWTDSILLKEKNTESSSKSLRSTRRKKHNTFEDKENSYLAESSRKGRRRLTNKHSSGSIIDLESDQEADVNRHESLQEETDDWRHSSLSKRPKYSRVDASRRQPSEESNPNNPNSKGEDTAEEEEDEKSCRQAVSSHVSCVICWTEFSPVRGILPCGHRFCYSCIQSWADRLVSQRKNSACPLCKASFSTIAKVEEDAGTSDQKIYSQTVPNPSSTNHILILPEQERLNLRNSNQAWACSRCYSREPEDLLIRCVICDFRCIHSYCLDPFLLPWTCSHCNDMQMLYNRGY